MYYLPGSTLNDVMDNQQCRLIFQLEWNLQLTLKHVKEDTDR